MDTTQHKQMTTRRLRMAIIIVAVGTLLVHLILMTSFDDYAYWTTPTRKLGRFKFGSSFDKWIVVTTINQPTEDVKYLSKIPGWKVVVVGDKKTPPNWSHPNCVFLDIKTQQELGFESVSHLSTGSYARKNIGYLYAIARGAKVIYETDDDNRPFDSLHNFILQPQTSGIMFAGKNNFNPYRHFGQPTLWPRGYPLNAIGENTSYRYFLQTWNTPSIQQGLVNGDPDMDAIFRLTRKNTLSILNVTFDMRAPPAIVPPGVFSPFNSQNTFFMYDAFWALLIPTTTTFRVCDIWRGYWAQRLLWEIGGTLGFFSPNAFQKRNSHSYLDDAVEEKDLYFQTTKLLSFLKGWNCHSDASFYKCVDTLSRDMAEHNFWQAGDVWLTQAWLNDLQKTGYKEPKRIQSNVSASVFAFPKGRSDKETPVDFCAVEQVSPLPHNSRTNTHPKWIHTESIIRFCPEISLRLPQHKLQKASHIYSNILLIIVFNFPHYENVNLMEVIYNLHFPHRLYCGSQINKFRNMTRWLQARLTFVEADTHKGYFGQACMLKAMEMNYRVDGYLYVGDDTLLNVWNLVSLPIGQPWLSNLVVLNYSKNETSDKWPWFKTKFGKTAFISAMKEIKRHNTSRYNEFTKMLQFNTKSPDGFYSGTSDIIYIPTRFKEDFIFFNKFFIKQKLFLEMAFPTFIGGVEDKSKIIHLNGKYLWYDGSRNHIEKHFNKTAHFLHPVKPKKELGTPKGVKFYCETYLPFTIPGVQLVKHTNL